MTALIYIDRKLSFGTDTYHFMEKDVIVGDMIELNTNVSETGVLLLPKIGCVWEKEVKRGLQSLMKSYLYILESDLNGYTIKNHLVNRTVSELTKTSDHIRIAVSPLTNENILQIDDDYERDDVKYLAVQGVGHNKADSEAVKEKVLAGIRKAIEHHVDILMYPEMLGTKTILEEALQEIAKNEIVKYNSAPFLVLLPTTWQVDGTQAINPWREGNNTNKLHIVISKDVFDGENLKTSIVQQKQVAYREREEEFQGRLEDIQSDKVIHILHLPGLGRIVFPICADLTDQNYRSRLLYTLKATLILCPSFSKGMDDFIQLTALGNDTGCRVIWCNSCAVQHLYKGNGEEVFENGDICCAGVSGIKRNYFSIKPEAICGNKCGKSCLFYLDIPLKKRITAEEAKDIKWKHLTENSKEEAV